jgi:hypothetical protein
MNESSKKTSRYAVGGVVILCLFIVLGWFALRPEPPSPTQQPVKVETPKPVASVSGPAEDLSSETPTNQPNDSAVTNAADLYRQAFALYDALTNGEKDILRDWRTNVDASVEAEFCEKIHPICDLMHHATAVTNCDWGDKRLTYNDSFGRHPGPSRAVARATLWNAAHCRSNDVAGATDDTLAALRLGQQISQGAMIGCLVGMAVQQMSSSYISQNLGSFRGSDAQRLIAALEDSSYEEAPSHAMEQEADMLDRFEAKLAAMSAAEGQKEVTEQANNMAKWEGESPMNVDLATTLAVYKQISDSERELAMALESSSEDELEAWQEEAAELQTSSPLARLLLESIEPFVDKVQSAEVNRALVVAGLAVAQGGAGALPSYPDPSSRQPFVYTETPGGFQLQSTYQVNGKPMTMRFK